MAKNSTKQVEEWLAICFFCKNPTDSHRKCCNCSRLIHTEMYITEKDKTPRCFAIGTVCYECADEILVDYYV